MIIAVLIAGAALVVVEVAARKGQADARPVANRDHWHSYFGLDVCGTWLPNAPQFEEEAGNPGIQPGIHTHGDGLIHTHPYTATEAGKNATVGRYFSYGGWKLTTDSFTMWTGGTHTNGQKCGTGADAKPAEVQWALGKFQKAWSGKPQTGDLNDYRQQNGDIIALYFLPKGAKLPEPPDAQTALANIEDIGGPATPITTAPGATSSTVAGGTTPGATAEPGATGSAPPVSTAPPASTTPPSTSSNPSSSTAASNSPSTTKP